jgi:beta-1,4-N-acetylglucosaminyltransferase
MKIGLVCSHGGHLTELLYLLEAFEEHDIFFVTYENPADESIAL